MKNLSISNNLKFLILHSSLRSRLDALLNLCARECVRMHMHVSGDNYGSHINPAFLLIQLPAGQFD